MNAEKKHLSYLLWTIVLNSSFYESNENTRDIAASYGYTCTISSPCEPSAQVRLKIGDFGAFCP